MFSNEAPTDLSSDLNTEYQGSKVRLLDGQNSNAATICPSSLIDHSGSSILHKPYQNNAPPQTFCCFHKRETNWKNMPNREIHPLIQDDSLPNNKIQTSKYTWLTFVPINLWEQFSQLANIYFLFIAFLQTRHGVSITGGSPVMLIPLSIIMTVSAIKALFEDFKRHKSDNEENNKSTYIFQQGEFRKGIWSSLRVGDIIKVNKNEPLPADIVLLYSKDPKGRCYVETKNLDGETNLKMKIAHKEISKHFNDSSKINNCSYTSILYDRPNPYLYQFKGTVTLGDSKVSIDYSNFLLRGCSLRNTEFAYGLVVYTGHETKIMLNSTKAKPKISRVERLLSKMVFLIFMIQIVFCVFTALYSRFALLANKASLYYLQFHKIDVKITVDLSLRLGNWILMFTNFVPISMMVTLEIIRFIQANMLSADEKMQTDDIAPSVQTSNLNEELGQVQYVFSDKTGTLTSNQMVFKKFSVNGAIYGNIGDILSLDDIDQLPSAKQFQKPDGIVNVDFQDDNFFKILDNPRHQENQDICEMLLAQAICHTVIVEYEKGKAGYSASSPDELALVNFAKYCGFEYMGTDEHNVMKIRARERELYFHVLNILEFSSDRKRMSIIVRDQNDQVHLYCKGADSIMFERMSKDTPIRIRESTNYVLKAFGNEGLRTLVYASKKLDNDTYEDWVQRYAEAMTSMVDREKKMEGLQAEIEKDFKLLGATGIEDKLQDQVGSTIQFISDADIKLWVLTGDKVETARSIGRSCSLIRQGMKEILIEDENDEDLAQSFVESHSHIKRKNSDSDPGFYIIITGETLVHLSHSVKSKELLYKFGKIALEAKTVLACRVSPKQKQEVVEMVRRMRPKAVTLAIGDGANDVNMIAAAHIGVGIKGKEGLQAARASDYSFGEFKHLKRLTFFYGREYYRKNTNVLFYNFYKNMILVFPQFWYGFTNIFSGQRLYDNLLSQFYNTLFAALPIILYALFDQQYTDKAFETHPSLYELGKRNRIFRIGNFVKTLINGAIQALFISLLAFYFMQNIAINNTGITADLWVSGAMVFSLAVFNINIKILIMSYTHNVLIVLSLVGTLVLYYLCLFLSSKYRTSSEIYDILHISESSLSYWASFVLILVITNGADMIIGRILYLDERHNYKLMNKEANEYQLNLKNGEYDGTLNNEESSCLSEPLRNTSYVL